VTVDILYGPKAAGKSLVAAVLYAQHGVAHVDADALMLDLIATGGQPHPRHGWLSQVEEAVASAREHHAAVSVEATGAWDTDWQLADDLTTAGERVVRVWVFAPLEMTLRRLADRTTRKAPVTEDDARWIWTTACERADHRQFDLVIDTSQLRETDLSQAIAPIAGLLPNA